MTRCNFGRTWSRFCATRPTVSYWLAGEAPSNIINEWLPQGWKKGARSEERIEGNRAGKSGKSTRTTKIQKNRENVEPLIFCTELALKWFAIKSCKSDEDCFTCKSLKQLPIPHYCKVDHCVRTPLLDFHFFFLVMSRVGIRSMINIGNNQTWSRSRLIVRRRAFNKEPSLFRNHSHAPQSR